MLSCGPLLMALRLGLYLLLGPHRSPSLPGSALHSPSQAHSVFMLWLGGSVGGSLSGFSAFVLMDPYPPLFITAVSIHTNGTVFAADTNITFVAVTNETVPMEFAWYFGDDPPVRTTSRSIRRRLSIPQWSVNMLFSADNANGQDKDHPGTITTVLLVLTLHPGPKHFCV